MPKAVALELGLEEGSLTGTWDYSHSLQIIWNNGLKKHTTVEDLINLVFSTMDEFRTRNSSAIFRASAAGLGHLILRRTRSKRQGLSGIWWGALRQEVANLREKWKWQEEKLIKSGDRGAV